MSADAAAELHEWDAAYVLGALSPAERALYEKHLASCAACRAAVAELAALPGLLAKASPAGLGADDRAGTAAHAAPVDPAQADSPTRPADVSLQALAHRVRHRRRARRWAASGAAALAAAAIATAVVLPMRLNAPPVPTASVTLEQTAPGPLSATVALTSTQWGTAVDLTCTYAGTPGAYATTGRYALYVTDAAGTTSRVASWSATPGETIRASGAVETRVSDMRTIELRDVASGATLLSSPVH